MIHVTRGSIPAMASQQEGNTDSLVTKPGIKSIVWDYFGLRKDPEGKPIDDGRVVCRSCLPLVVAKHGNTCNLVTHLWVNHSRIHSELQDAMKKKSSTSEAGSPATQITLQASMEKY